MDVLMPQLGETVAEGKIVKWFKSPGDVVNPGDNLFEIETDKTSMEVPATFAGTLNEIRFNVGEVAKVGAVVAVIAGAGAPMAAPSKPTDVSPPLTPLPGYSPSMARAQTPTLAPSPTSLSPRFHGQQRVENASYAYSPMDPFREVRTPERNFGPARLPGGVTITPLARRLAGEKGIDLSGVNGTGPHGRIIAADIEKTAPSAAVRGISMEVSAAQVKEFFEGVPYREVPLDATRRSIVARLIEAQQTVPHFYLMADLNVDRLLGLLEETNAVAPRNNENQPTFKILLNDFIIKAWAIALQRVPAAKAVWADDRILNFVHSDIGVAIELDDGVMTPVLHHVETKSLTMISSEIRELAKRAGAQKLNFSNAQDSISAIFNLGTYGVREFSAIVVPPHSTTLAVGACRRVPIETEDGSVKFINQLTVTLCCDQRVLDVAIGARLLTTFKGFIERPLAALAE